MVPLIEKYLINGEYPLVNNDLDLGKVFGEQIPIVSSIVIKDADLRLDLPNSIFLAGIANILNFGEVTIEITIESKKIPTTATSTTSTTETTTTTTKVTATTPAPTTPTTPAPTTSTTPAPTTSTTPAPTTSTTDTTTTPTTKTIRTYTIHIMLPKGKLGNLLYTLAYEAIKGISMPAELPLPQIDFSDFYLSVTPATKEYKLIVKSLTDWVFNAGPTGFTVSDINFSLTRDSKGKTTGTFSGGIAIGNVSVNVDCIIPGKFELKTVIPSLNFSSLLQDLCGPSSVFDAPIPSSILGLDINNLNFSLIVENSEYKFNLSGETKFGKAQLVINKKDSKWIFIVGFAPPETFKYSEINEALVVLDGLKLPNTALILSSVEIKSTEISTIDIGREVLLKKGVNLFVTFDAKDTIIDKLIGLDTLGLTGQIGISPFSLLLAISLEGNINIANILELRGFNFEIAVPPLSLAFKTKIALQLASDLLLFTIGAKFSLADTTLSLAGTMEGTWNEPFGFKGIAIGDVALELGLNLSTTPIPMPVIGVAGSLKVGDFYGSGAVKYNPTNPAQSMLLIKFNKLYLVDIFKVFCNSTILSKFTSGFLDFINTIGFENVELYIVPATTYIGELKYDAGFRIKGFMRFLDWTGEIDARLDYEKGIKIYGKCDPIEIPGVFALRGAGDSPNPIVDMAYIAEEQPYLYITGSIEILGIKIETNINYDGTKFQILVTNKIFNLWSATLLVEGENLWKATEIRIRAIIHNDIIDTIKVGLIEAIQTYANTTDAVYNELLKEVDEAQSAVDDFGRQITALTGQITQERAQVTSDLEKAQFEVNKKRGELEAAQALVDSMRAQIEAEHAKASADLKKAKADLESAQKIYNDLGIPIDQKKARIAQLNLEINNLKNAISKLRLYEKWKAIGYYALIAAKGLEITVLYAEIGVLELARLAAWGVLEGCQAVLSLAQSLIVNTPIELDPRMVVLIAAKEVAAATLLIADNILEGIQELVENIPVELDPRIVALRTLEGAAKVTLEAAELALKGFQAGQNFILNTAKEILTKSFDLTFRMTKIWFDAKLGAVSGGIINLVFEVVFMGNVRKIMFEFNFKDIPGSFARLGKQIITGEFKEPTQVDIIDIETIVLQKRTLDLPPVAEPAPFIPLLEASPPPITQPPLVTGPIMIPVQSTTPETQITEEITAPEPQVAEPFTTPESQVIEPSSSTESQGVEPSTSTESQIAEPPSSTESQEAATTYSESQVIEPPSSTESQEAAPTYSESQVVEPPSSTESQVSEQSTTQETEGIVLLGIENVDPQEAKVYKSVSSDLDKLLIDGKKAKGVDKLLDKGEEVVDKILDKGQEIVKDLIEDHLDDLLDIDLDSKKKKKNKKKDK